MLTILDLFLVVLPKWSAIAEAVFAALVEPLPDRVTAAPAGTSGNFALGGFDAEHDRDFVMYQLSGGGYGGSAEGTV